MKHINTYINEKLKISNKKEPHTLFPNDKKELQEMIEKENYEPSAPTTTPAATNEMIIVHITSVNGTHSNGRML